MSLRNWTPKVAALVVTGCVITVLFIMSVTALWRHQLRPATLYFMFGVVLALAFFRHRKIALAIVGLSFVLVNVGFHALFHPTPVGIAITVVSAFLLYSLVLWGARRHPRLAAKDWKTLFDRDPIG